MAENKTIAMDPKDIRLEDLERILFGEAPAIFLLETMFRTLLIYLFLLLVIRWLGKRMSGQLSINEMAVMLVLGAIVSVPMQVPGSGLAQGVLLLVCTLTFQRGMSWLGYHSRPFEKVAMGGPVMLVRDGTLELKEMKENRITRQLIFSELRQNGISCLGAVERLYLESSGIFSMYCSPEPQAGLSVYPPGDHGLWTGQDKAEGFLACKNCGETGRYKDGDACGNCGETDWTGAVTGK